MGSHPGVEMTTALDTQVDEDIDLLVCRQNNQPPPKTLWPIATENQTHLVLQLPYYLNPLIYCLAESMCFHFGYKSMQHLH